LPIPGTQGHPPTNLPPRTIVKIVLNPAKGSNINVEVWLPDPGKWNGRLLGFGNGGSAGHIGEGIFFGALQAGYASVTTDMGTAPNADSGDGNPEVWKDFGFRATHLMTVVARQLVQTYYGKGPDFSYFTGGSTGGQQALQETQRYPADYDGIVASIPAHCRTPLHAYFLWNYQILAQCPFTKAQEENVIAAANEYMAPREVPAIAGKFISDPRCDSKDIEAVIALARQKDPSLTDAHAAALRKLFDGPKDEVTGERIFDGIPLGSEFGPATGNLYLFKWVFGAKKDLRTINFGADIDAYTAALGPYLNAENPDLTPFESRGGKLIMVAGSADSVVPYHVSIDYYEKVIAHFGSLDKVQSFFRFYIIPGMAHGGGGPGLSPAADLVALVRTWREKGTAPEALTGRRGANGKVELTMPIYPYPAKTGWDAATSSYHPVEGPRGGVEPVSSRFLPPAAE
jgi:feruloyl esterase